MARKSPAPARRYDPTLSFFDTIEDAVDRGRAMVQVNFEALNGEGRRFMAQMATDAEEALEHFKTCKSPLEVAAVQQAWFAARAKAYVDAGLRLFHGPDAQGPDAQGPETQGPETRGPETRGPDAESRP